LAFGNRSLRVQERVLDETKVWRKKPAREAEKDRPVNSRHWWFTPIILATQEAGIRRIRV
jgi:hypothetical protein